MAENPTPVQSWATSEHARATMRANRGSNTKPELAIRAILHKSGLRYRVNSRPIQTIRRTADIVFTKQRLAVFVDGCFWHGCPLHYAAPKQNAGFWADKIANNRSRDSETNELLRSAGWTVIRVWEHDPADEVASRIVTIRRSLSLGAEP